MLLFIFSDPLKDWIFGYENFRRDENGFPVSFSYFKLIRKRALNCFMPLVLFVRAEIFKLFRNFYSLVFTIQKLKLSTALAGNAPAKSCS